MRSIESYLQQIDQVIASGPFTDTWESLKSSKIPEWFSRDRFGIFIHWGCFTVPEAASEWYPRRMYWRFTKAWKHKNKTYGKDADYRSIAMQFNPQKFDAHEWVDLFKRSGARYITPVGEHHDGIKLYASQLNQWTTVNMTPKRDYMHELHEECDKSGMRMLMSNHRAEHYWFMNGARFNFPQSEALTDEYKELYGECKLAPCEFIPIAQLITASPEWMEDWLASACEMVDVNRPKGIYFDWWIEQHEFRPYVKKFLAYYYNRGVEWGFHPVVFYKYNGMMQGSAVFDVERGQINTIAREPWQCDTSIAKNSWCYTKNNEFKSAAACICNLIDVVSKNGNLMLNVGPKANGEICEEEKYVLLSIGKWLKINGEAIFDSEPYVTFGEGKKQGGGAFNDNLSYTTRDYRFTYKVGAIYVFPLSTKARKTFSVKSLRHAKNRGITYLIKGISLLGSTAKVSWKHSVRSLKITLDDSIKSDTPICFKIDID